MIGNLEEILLMRIDDFLTLVLEHVTLTIVLKKKVFDQSEIIDELCFSL